CVKGSEDFDYW
nr:immunoglobulin heavy chain junction region [Macaca mulatta]MOY21869.1 immunoglobulin heavy chain junction region [Macaca mulatta]MOY22238.1 immunoglobulin heavy chain junction region [Macaca mulatta]MOY24000.1 immunoglobulin heavy chain junction region [Macaca mulatta]MOY25657.1 immunoglobulin heavy chain junction region [Macaca mulatta]